MKKSALLNNGQNESTNAGLLSCQTLIHNREIKLAVTSDTVKILSLTAVPPAGAERMEEITMYVLYGNETLAGPINQSIIFFSNAGSHS